MRRKRRARKGGEKGESGEGGGRWGEVVMEEVGEGRGRKGGR